MKSIDTEILALLQGRSMTVVQMMTELNRERPWWRKVGFHHIYPALNRLRKAGKLESYWVRIGLDERRMMLKVKEDAQN